MKKDVKLASVFFLALLLLVPASYGFGVSGAIYKAEVIPGQKISHEIVVYNEGNNTSFKNFTAEIFGFFRTIDGAIMEVPPEKDTSSFTARPFLSIEPNSFSLKPNEMKVLFINGTIPEDIGHGGRYAIGVISTIPSASEGVGISTAVLVPIYLTIKDTDQVLKGNISSLIASQNEKGVAVELIINNTGNIHFKPLVAINLLDQTGQLLNEEKIELNQSNAILPMGSLRFNKTFLRNLSPGNYRVEARISLEDGTLVDSRKNEFEIK